MRLLILSCILFSMLPSSPAFAGDKRIIGWVENAVIYPGAYEFHAKMDTGARHSSIHATDIVEFERDDQTWVRFKILDKKQVQSTMELPLVREVTIKRHFGRKQHRHVVMLGICLGKVYKQTEATLVDREGFIYELLIGRSFLKKDFIVNVSEQYTSKPRCKVPETQE